MTDLLVSGSTVVTAERSFRADVAIGAGRIERVGERLAPSGAPTIDATGLLVLPGVIDVHTHLRLPSHEEPDRFYADTVAAAMGGTTTLLTFNNPGTGIGEESGRSLLRGLHEFRSRTEDESAIDFSLSAVITGAHESPVAEVPKLIAAGVPTFKAFMVYDFRLTDEALLAVLTATAAAGGMLQLHCENATIVDALTARELEAGHLGCAGHVASRPSYAEAEATHRAIALARAASASVYLVHLSSAEALAEVVAAKAVGLPVHAETCPHYLALTDERYGAEEGEAIRYLISPPLRSAPDREALWLGLARRGLDVVASDHVPDRLAVEKRVPAPPFDRVSNGAPGIETLLSVTYSAGVAGGRIPVERLVNLLATTPARLFGLPSKGAIEAGRDADLVLLDPSARRTLRAAELHHTSDYTPYEAMELRGAVRAVVSRGEVIVRDGQFLGRRGHGRFIERSLGGLTE